jgi:hypothetical protein
LANEKVSRVCEAIKPEGRQCEAAAIAGSRYCYFHDPGKARDRKAAQQAGGRARSRRMAVLPGGTPDYPLETAAQGIALLREVVNKVIRGDLDPKIATTVGYLISIVIRGFSQHEFESRIAMLEDVLKDQRSLAESPIASEPAAEFEFLQKASGEEEKIGEDVESDEER